MPKWSYKSQLISKGQYVISIVAPYSDEWRQEAPLLGARYAYPFRDDKNWQYTVPGQEAATKLLELITPKLNQIYPDQDGEDTNVSIDLTRRSNTPPWVVSEAEPKKEVVTTQQIAAAVSKVVTKAVLAQVEEQAEQLKLGVDSKIARSERRVVENLDAMQETVSLVNKRLDQVLQPTIVYITKKELQEISFTGTTHCQFSKLLKQVQLLAPERRNVWIAGPAGSGKTTAARQIAEALQLPFFFNGSIDTEYKLSGFIDAQGRVISTAFRQAWEQGGVYLFDECDGSMASALLAFNAALANGHASFPDAVSSRHPDTVILAAANTYGWGGTANYVGRAKLDGAFLDRFNKLPWKYDERLERFASLSVNPDAGAWIEAVQGTRKLVFERKASVIISPRRSINGAELLAGGMSREDVVESQFSDLTEHSAWSMISSYLDRFVRLAA